MDYQHFTIIFVLIVLPLSIVLSYHIKNQSDTIDLQSSYQAKLESSTYDAVTAFQINSLNTQRTSGESVKAYVSASINTFFTTLASNFGMTNASKSRLQSYVPAILFTTYDGYYIYSPTKTKEIAINQENGQGIVTPEGDLVYTKSGTDENAYRVNKTTASSYSNGTSTVSGDYTIKPSDAKDISSYMLKPFIYYSARYNFNNNNVVASYSLDNYLTTYGTINGKEFSKSGYIIDPSKIEINGDLLIKLISKNPSSSYDSPSNSDLPGFNSSNSDEFKNYIDEIFQANSDTSNNNYNHVRYLRIGVKTDEAYNYINDYLYGETIAHGNYFANRVYTDKDQNKVINRTQTGDKIIEDTLNINEYIGNDTNRRDSLIYDNVSGYEPLTVFFFFFYANYQIEITDKDAKEYYIKAYFYSKWIQQNLGNIQAKNIDQNYIEEKVLNNSGRNAFTFFNDDDTQIFNIGPDNDPESDASDFQQHKRNVIKNTIQYNLNSAISTYTENFYNLEHEYRLPIISETDWDKILDNVSMTTFFQGVPAGTKTFNSYAVITSTNNNTSVDIDNMYFVANRDWNNEKR